MGVGVRSRFEREVSWVLAILYLRCQSDCQIEVPSVLYARSRLEKKEVWRLVCGHCVCSCGLGSE